MLMSRFEGSQPFLGAFFSRLHRPFGDHGSGGMRSCGSLRLSAQQLALRDVRGDVGALRCLWSSICGV